MEALKSHTEVISLLKTIADVISKPGHLQAMHDSARKEMALTVAEVDKVAKAKELILTYDRLNSELNLRSHDLAEAEKSFAERLTSVIAREKTVTSAEEAVRIRVANQAEIDKRRLDERKQLDKERSEFDAMHYATRTALVIERDKLESDKKRLAAEASNLLSEKKTLAESIEKIRNRA